MDDQTGGKWRKNASWADLDKKEVARIFQQKMADKGWSKPLHLKMPVIWIMVIDADGMPEIDGKVTTIKKLKNRLSTPYYAVLRGEGLGKEYKDLFRRALDADKPTLLEYEKKYNAILNRTETSQPIATPLSAMLHNRGEFEVFTSISREGTLLLDEKIPEEKPRTEFGPPDLSHRLGNEIIGIKISGNSLAPRYEAGETMWIDLIENFEIGNWVLVCPSDQARDGRRMVRKLIGISSSLWKLNKWHLPTGRYVEEEVCREDWPILYKILSATGPSAKSGPVDLG